MKKATAFLTTACACLLVNATAFAASITADEALVIAQKQVPASSTHIVTKVEMSKINPYYEVEFYDTSTSTQYEIDVLQANGAIKEFSMDAKALLGSKNVTLSKNDVEAIVKKEYPEAVFKKIELDIDNGLYEYEVKFTAPGVRGEYTLNPETGVIMEKELKYQF